MVAFFVAQLTLVSTADKIAGMTGIVDYNAGNIRSVERALSFLQVEYMVSKNPSDLAGVDRVIFPGVGDAQYAMTQLRSTGFDVFLREYAESGRPLLGICLGSQIVLEKTAEGNTNCLGLLSGSVDVLPQSILSQGFKIPHMGWNSVHYEHSCPLFESIPDNSDFYFVHSYYLNPADNSVVAGATDYGMRVPCVLQRELLFAVQFHPEKSGANGLQMLRNFCALGGR